MTTTPHPCPATLPRRAALRGTLILALPLLLPLTGCAPLLVGGAALGGAMVVTDRRTSGTQVEDQGIEIKGRLRLREALGERIRFQLNSYDREVLLVGEVTSAADRDRAEQLAGRVENVRRVINELEVVATIGPAERSSDLLLSTKVQATLVDAKDLTANAFAVTIDRGVVYLMGKVTQAEAGRASELIRNIEGVRKVVLILQIITPEELAERLGRR